MPTYVRLHKEPPKGARNIKREGTIIWKVGHVGKVVRAYDVYVGDGDSGYMATVFEGGTFKNINVGSTYESPAGHGVVDAPPALMERWRKYEAARKEKIRKEQAARDAVREKERVAYALTQPHRGGMVQVVKGRKVPIGFVGRVVWAGDSAFGPRLRIQNETGEAYFIAAGNVKVLSQPPGFKP